MDETGLRESHLYIVIATLLVAIAAVGALTQADVLAGLWRIQVHPARLLNDFTTVGGEGAALVNAVLVAVLGLAVVRVVGVRLSGPTVAAVFTMFGFGLFGKTPLNALPIFIGVAVAARIAGKTFKEYILMAMYGTALGPLITALAVEAGLPVVGALAVAVVGGVVAGVVLPAVAIAMLRFHQGFNLYNIGMTSGFIAVFGASILVAANAGPPAALVWNDAPSTLLVFLVPAVSAVLIAAGILAGPRAAVAEVRAILRLPGRLPSDFMSMVSARGSLVNAGIMGILLWAYVLLVGGSLNGPVLGGIFTAVGFATFGKHPRNGWPVMAGVVIACLVFGKSLASPGPLLAALFVLTLSPLAGEFGWHIGLLAGFLHLVMVQRTGARHLGINLYNNGFAGGLTATLFVAVLEWYNSRSARENPRGRDSGDSS